MTKDRVIEINAETSSYAEAQAQMEYEMGFEYYLKAGSKDNGIGLEQVFGANFFRGWLAAKRTPAHLLRMKLAHA